VNLKFVTDLGSLLLRIYFQVNAHVTNIQHQLVPQKSSFVAAARDQIPPTGVRVSSTQVRGRGRGRGRGRARVAGQDQGQGRGRAEGQGRAKATTKRASNVASGSAKRQHQQANVPDLNVPVDVNEAPVSQNAPHTQNLMCCCQFECTSYTDRCMFT
jgi:hypothetical protein